MLRMAGRAGLSPAFADMPDTNVSMAANPEQASRIKTIKAKGSSISVPIKNRKRRKVKRPITLR